jgi:retron-type reverse transcriptase
LSNIMLDDLDRELFERGHRFVRCADDVRVFVRGKRAAHRVLDSVTAVVEQRLKLKVNREKSRVVPASVMTMLGRSASTSPEAGSGSERTRRRSSV